MYGKLLKFEYLNAQIKVSPLFKTKQYFFAKLKLDKMLRNRDVFFNVLNLDFDFRLGWII